MARIFARVRKFRHAALRHICICVLPAAGLVTHCFTRALPTQAAGTDRSLDLPFVPPPVGLRGQRVVRLAQRELEASAFQQIDSRYNPEWLTIKERTLESLEWAHPQTPWAVAATGVYAFDVVRILCLVPPTPFEVVALACVYLFLYASRFDEVPRLEPHYQVSFYASVGWTFYAWVSLVHNMAYSATPVLPLSVAEPLHAAACGVFLASCLYFYGYHWGRQLRHALEGRFRPWFAAGLASLTVVHGFTVGHIWKVVDDPGWFATVLRVYPDQWRWIADVRLLELYLTSAALFLVILHVRGVLKGTKNAAVVFLGTVILPSVALLFETRCVDAVAWQHYFMVGPKHF